MELLRRDTGAQLPNIGLHESVCKVLTENQIGYGQQLNTPWRLVANG